MSFTDKEISDRIESNNKLVDKIQSKIDLIKKEETEQCTIHSVVGRSEQCCEPVSEGLYLGISCPKCKRPFRQNLK
ncbi:hypothetical protein M1M25_gp062 [Tenacibaculum phage Gundel_1]|uniref:Uncharacterized protein n=1 Tax=Tenacibaculum phage Gundel_1 TaxID=2745672 RepID=A0A8E5EC40_9CAUD|nr:hypothetical protein M1M25_gp062 [Tenacibaculum phage Gundel_1]QQV91497.1 hypothetical protein Gundel1_62 [Tenacibaculum phage Gundel_1]